MESTVPQTTSQTHDAAVRLLHAARQRATPQRVAVLEALLQANTHLTADQMFSNLSDRVPSLTLSTVYRTLERLREVGLITETDLGEGARHFELFGDEPHHHLVCQGCGAMLDLDDRLVAPLRDRIRDELGFAPRLDHLAVFGLCAYCQGKETGSS
jgi:Fur family ferric uptake transcriptional regulator